MGPNGRRGHRNFARCVPHGNDRGLGGANAVSADTTVLIDPARGSGRAPETRRVPVQRADDLLICDVVVAEARPGGVRSRDRDRPCFRAFNRIRVDSSDAAAWAVDTRRRLGGQPSRSRRFDHCRRAWHSDAIVVTRNRATSRSREFGSSATAEDGVVHPVGHDRSRRTPKRTAAGHRLPRRLPGDRPVGLVDLAALRGGWVDRYGTRRETRGGHRSPRARCGGGRRHGRTALLRLRHRWRRAGRPCGRW